MKIDSNNGYSATIVPVERALVGGSTIPSCTVQSNQQAVVLSLSVRVIFSGRNN